MGLNRTPADWVAGEIPTAAKMNAEIRNLWTGLQAPWDTYAPTWTCQTGAQPSLGNGSLTGRYLQIGKTIAAWSITLTMGSSTTYGGGWWMLSPPSAAPAARVSLPVEYLDTNVNQWTGRGIFTGTAIFLVAQPTAAGAADRAISGASVPFAWGAGDVLTVTGVPYEIS